MVLVNGSAIVRYYFEANENKPDDTGTPLNFFDDACVVERERNMVVNGEAGNRAFVT